MRKKLTIVNVEGVVVENPENLRKLIRDFAAIEGLKLFVHGEGTMASMVAEKMGINIRQASDGRDIIDDRVMDLVTMVYGGLVNKRLVAIMQWRGLNAVGLTGVDLNLVLSTKVPVKPVNVGRVGTVKRVNSTMLVKMLDEGLVDEARAFLKSYNEILDENGFAALRLSKKIKAQLEEAELQKEVGREESVEE